MTVSLLDVRLPSESLDKFSARHPDRPSVITSMQMLCLEEKVTRESSMFAKLPRGGIEIPA